MHLYLSVWDHKAGIAATTDSQVRPHPCFAGMLNAELTGRPKNLWGVHQKMCLKGHSLRDVYDVRAVRIIVDTKADCYTALQQVGWEGVCQQSGVAWCTLDGKLACCTARVTDRGCCEVGGCASA